METQHDDVTKGCRWSLRAVWECCESAGPQGPPRRFRVGVCQREFTHCSLVLRQLFKRQDLGAWLSLGNTFHLAHVICTGVLRAHFQAPGSCLSIKTTNLGHHLGNVGNTERREGLGCFPFSFPDVLRTRVYSGVHMSPSPAQVCPVPRRRSGAFLPPPGLSQITCSLIGFCLIPTLITPGFGLRFVTAVFSSAQERPRLTWAVWTALVWADRMPGGGGVHRFTRTAPNCPPRLQTTLSQ